MFYVISRSTDLRDRNTKMRKFTSLKAALNFARINNGNFTHDNPTAARNYHHTFKYVYELKGKILKSDPIFKERGSSSYPQTDLDNLVSYLYKYGKEIDARNEE